MTALQSPDITLHNRSLNVVEVNTPGKGWRQAAYPFLNIKVFGLQSAAMSRNSESLHRDSASYTSVIHVYIHQRCQT